MIHPTAIVHPDASIGENVHIGPFCVVEKGVSVGSGCVLKSHVSITGNTFIGENNTIYPFVSIGAEPQDKKYANEDTQTYIGNDNTIREYVSINRGTVDDAGKTVVGDDNWIMAYVHIAHDCMVGDHTILANGATLAGHVHIGDWVILGGFTKVHQFCRIGEHAFTAMDCGLQKDVPPFVMAHGNPAVPRAINFEGLKRRGFDKKALSQIKQAYRTLYKAELNLADALEQMHNELGDSEHVEKMIGFIRQSKRSIIR